MLFCSSFTWSTRFLQTDQLVTRLQRVETTCCKVVPNFIRVMMGNVTVNVMETDAVFWWATIFCTPSSLYDKMLQSVTDPVLDDEQLEES